MKKLLRLGPVLSCLEASTASLWLWSCRSGKGGWGCGHRSLQGQVQHSRAQMWSQVHIPNLGLQPWFVRLRPPSTPRSPTALSWDVSRGQLGWVGVEVCVFGRGGVWGCASTTAARADKPVPENRLRARVRSCCPASGKSCLVGGGWDSGCIHRNQMSCPYQSKIRGGWSQLRLVKPGLCLRS